MPNHRNFLLKTDIKNPIHFLENSFKTTLSSQSASKTKNTQPASERIASQKNFSRQRQQEGRFGPRSFMRILRRWVIRRTRARARDKIKRLSPSPPHIRTVGIWISNPRSFFGGGIEDRSVILNNGKVGEVDPAGGGL